MIENGRQATCNIYVLSCLSAISRLNTAVAELADIVQPLKTIDVKQMKADTGKLASLVKSMKTAVAHATEAATSNKLTLSKLNLIDTKETKTIKNFIKFVQDIDLQPLNQIEDMTEHFEQLKAATTTLDKLIVKIPKKVKRKRQEPFSDVAWFAGALSNVCSE